MSSPRKNPLKVEGGPMTRVRTKRVKEAMGLLVKTTIDEIMFGTQNGTNFVFGSKAETNWINTIQAAEDGAGEKIHATAWLKSSCSRTE